MRSASLSSPRRRRGSVLLVCLIFAAVIAISLGSFLRLASTASTLSYRTFYLGAAMNIAETGLEQAVWAINRSTAGETDAWDGWAASGSVATRTFTLDNLDGGASAVVKVRAVQGTIPSVMVRSIVTPPRGAPIEKWVKVTLSRRSLFAIGGLGRDGIVANGNNVYMASWNSDPDNDPSTPYLPYTASLKNDSVSLATVKIDAEIDSGQADINGTAAVGASSSSDSFDITDYIKVGTQGYIGPFDTPVGTLDPDSVSADFTADLQVQDAPSGKTYTSLGAITNSITLPRVGDTAEADGIYYYTATQVSLTNKTLSVTPGKNVVMKVDYASGGSVKVGGGSGALNVGGTVVTNSATGAVTHTPASLEIYTSGDVDIGGQGAGNTVTTQTYIPATTTLTTTDTATTISNVTDLYGTGKYKTTLIGWTYKQTIVTTTTAGSGSPTTVTSGPTTYTTLIASGGTKPVAGTTNTTNSTSSSTPAITTDTGTQPGQPKSLRIYGTRTTADVATYGNQAITISGNGNLSAVVYAPNANISAKGGGNSGFMYGSLVGASLLFTGNDSFYYDESLANLDGDAGYSLKSWSEFSLAYMSAADKALMNF